MNTAARDLPQPIVFMDPRDEPEDDVKESGWVAENPPPLSCGKFRALNLYGKSADIPASITDFPRKPQLKSTWGRDRTVAG
jgi:hypothetical protein